MPLSRTLTWAQVRELKLEKRRLQQWLRDYERTFESREGRKASVEGCAYTASLRCLQEQCLPRQVQFVRDIAPVLEQYQRYKHLKTLLKELS